MENFSSTFWIFTIVFGAFLVALGNVQFNIALDRERINGASNKARYLLKPELEQNLIQIRAMRDNLNQNSMSSMGLQSNSWKILSDGGLLIQLNENTILEITEIYNMTETINSYHQRLWETSRGLESAMSGSQQTKTEMINLILKGVNSLEPKIIQTIDKINQK